MKRFKRPLLLFGVSIICFAVVASGIFSSQASVGSKRQKRKVDTSRGSTETGKPLPPVTASIAPGDFTVLINEVDSDQVGTDAAEFVELKAAPGTSLNGYVLVFYNGSSDQSYAAFDLDGLTADANGFVVVGNTGVPGVDLTFGGNILQNGEDAVALYTGDATSFPNGTGVTTTNLVDAVVYDTADADDLGLLPLLNAGVGQMQIDETGGSSSTTNSIQRCVDNPRDWREFVVRVPTPNAANSGCQSRQSIADMNDDGRTDYVLMRPVGGGFAGASATNDLDSRVRLSGRERIKARIAQSTGESLQVGPAATPRQWWTLYNTPEYPYSGATWGDAETDEPLVADFDGDGKDDITVWRYGAALGDQAYFLSINSSDFTVREVAFGTRFDNPWVVADYDGDGIDDPAVYRCPFAETGQCYYYYQGSLNNPTNVESNMPFGIGTVDDYLPVRGDYNGDGKADFCIQGANPDPAGGGVFYTFINGSSSFTGVQWGALSDRIVPGDFDGDGKSDYAVTRIIGNDLWWYILEQDGGTKFQQWGSPADIEAAGDYDGDGKTDIAIYRWNESDGQFWVIPSSGSAYALQWGAPGDYPASYFFVQ